MTIEYGKTDLVTTAPAATSEYSPIVIPAMMVAFAPMEHPFFKTVWENFSGYLLLRG